MAWAKQIKSKIKSVANIQKMTKALEIVSTIKLQQIKQQTEKYRDFLTEFLKIAQVIHQKVNLFEQDENTNSNDKTLLIVISTDRWLCGSINSRLFKKIKNRYNDFSKLDVYCVWKKAKEFFERNWWNILQTINIKDKFNENDLNWLTKLLQEAIQENKYNSVEIAFNYFQNTISQVPVILNLYPFNKEDIDQFVQQVWKINLNEYLNDQISNKEITFEPNLSKIRKEFIRQLVQHLIYWAVLQNKTWEFASRMLAMKNAKDNAWEIQRKLILQFNKVRQWNITQEISEIVWAKTAMEE